MARRNASNMFYMFRFMKLAAPRGPAGPRFSFLRMILPCATVSVAVRPVLMRRTRHPTCSGPRLLSTRTRNVAIARLANRACAPGRVPPTRGCFQPTSSRVVCPPLHSRQRAPDLRATDRIRAPARGAMHPPLGQCRRAGLHDRLRSMCGLWTVRNLNNLCQRFIIMVLTSCLRDFSLEKMRLSTAHPLVSWLGISSENRR